MRPFSAFGFRASFDLWISVFGIHGHRLWDRCGQAEFRAALAPHSGPNMVIACGSKGVRLSSQLLE